LWEKFQGESGKGRLGHKGERVRRMSFLNRGEKGQQQVPDVESLPRIGRHYALSKCPPLLRKLRRETHLCFHPGEEQELL
jgi:hypothetical protein